MGAQLRRHHGRAQAAAGAAAQCAAQRHHRHRRGHEHRHSAAQPARGGAGLYPSAQGSGRLPGRPARIHQRPGFPHRGGNHHAAQRHHPHVRGRQGQPEAARRLRARGKRHRDHRAALPGVRRQGAGTDRRSDAEEKAAHGQRPARRIRPRKPHSSDHHAALQPGGYRATDGPPVRHHRPGKELPGQPEHDRHR